MLRITSIIFLFVSAELCFAATAPDERAIVPATGLQLPTSSGVPTMSDEEIARVDHDITSAFKGEGKGAIRQVLSFLKDDREFFHEDGTPFSPKEYGDKLREVLSVMIVGGSFAVDNLSTDVGVLFKACQYIVYNFLKKTKKNTKESVFFNFSEEELKKHPEFIGCCVGWLFTEQFGHLPFLRKYRKNCQNMTILGLPYVVMDGLLFLNNKSNAGSMLFVYDLETNTAIDNSGISLSFIKNPTKNTFIEHIRWRHRGGQTEYASAALNGSVVIGLMGEKKVAEGHGGKSLARELLGDDYPTEQRKGQYADKDYFIPFPDTTEEREEVYEEVVRELVKDYRSTQDEAERDAILETLVGFGESTRLLEDIPEPVRPEGLSDGQWRKRLNREKGKSEKRQKALETKINNAQQEVARKMAVERALKGRIIEDVPHTEEVAAPVPAEAPVLSSDEERELAILKEIEEANKKAREEKAARKATEKKEESSGGAGAPVFAGAGAATGAGTSLSTVDDSNLPKKGRVSFKGIVRMIKDYAKRNGSSVAIDESTASSHFTVTAEDGTKTTLVRKHGGDTSAPVRIVGKILGKLFGKKEA